MPRIVNPYHGVKTFTPHSNDNMRELLAYEVYRSTFSGGGYTSIGAVDASETTYFDDGLTNGTTAIALVEIDNAVGVGGDHAQPGDHDSPAIPGTGSEPSNRRECPGDD